jgi:hypothetical protein
MNFYAHKKVSELERDLRDAKAKHPQLEREHRPAVFGPLALRAAMRWAFRREARILGRSALARNEKPSSSRRALGTDKGVTLMDDFYMQSEINDRERQIRQRQSKPQDDEAKRPLLAPVSGLFASFARAYRKHGHDGDAPTQMVFQKQDGKLQILRGIPLFAGLKSRDLDAIASLSDLRDVPAGLELVRAGETSRQFVILVSGAAVARHTNGVTAVIQSGAFFGDVEITLDQPYSSTFTADTRATILVIERRSFRRLLDDVPAFQRRLLESVCGRLHHAESVPGRPVTRSPFGQVGVEASAG